MGILDEAIREHLELKRQHGAGDSELKQLEDEAFGPADRPGSEQSDAAAEAPTEFMTAPETGQEDAAAAVQEAAPRRESEASIADLQEAPPATDEESGVEAAEEPAEEEQPAGEHQTIAPAPSEEAPSRETDEHQAIAEQPTQHFDVEEEFAAAGKAAPSDEDLVEQEMEEPRLAPVDPLADPELDQPGEVEAAKVEPAEQGAPPVEEEDEDFWDERRLSEELDQALEAPITEPRDQPATAEEPLPQERVSEESAAAEHSEHDDDAEPEAPRSRSDSDLLEDTPDFLEDAPEDDQLWFEQKPPKDFDFDD